MTGWLFAVGAVLVAFAALRVRTDLRRRTSESLSDGDIRRIEASGTVERDEPLDLDEIADEEERFWGETWDVPDAPF